MVTLRLCGNCGIVVYGDAQNLNLCIGVLQSRLRMLTDTNNRVAARKVAR